MTFLSYPPEQKIAFAAMHYRALGQCVGIFPVVGKIPSIRRREDSWLAYPRSRMIARDGWEAATGYAVAPSPGSRLVIIDCDDHEFTQRLLLMLPAVVNTYRVERGDHSHFYVKIARDLLGATISLRDDRGEVASLRGSGSYVVGAGSDHPESGGHYSYGGGELIELNDEDTVRLLSLFTPARASATPTRTDSSDLDRVVIALGDRGYRSNRRGWINGCCVFHEDHHPSAGLNLSSGIFHCFACGDYSLQQVGERLGVLQPRPPATFQFTTPDQPDAIIDDRPTVRCELNVATALARRREYAAARFFDLLSEHSRSAEGQHSYTWAELAEIGSIYGLSEAQSRRGVGALLRLGLVERDSHNAYRRVGYARCAQILQIDPDQYAGISIPIERYKTIGEYRRAVTVAVERALPANLSTATIAAAAGVSPRTIYYHESRSGVKRIANIERCSPVSTAVSFSKVNGRSFSRNDAPESISVGRAWGFAQYPSTRVLSGIL